MWGYKQAPIVRMVIQGEVLINVSLEGKIL